MLFVTASLFLLLSQAASQQSPTAPCGDVSTVDDFGPKTAAEARAFLVHFQAAVARDDRKSVASMAHYPLRVQLKGRPTLLKTSASLLHNYPNIFTPAVKNAIKSQSVACLAYASTGYTQERGSATSFAIGNGEVWFNSESEDGPLKIITINNDSPH